MYNIPCFVVCLSEVGTTVHNIVYDVDGGGAVEIQAIIINMR